VAVPVPELELVAEMVGVQLEVTDLVQDPVLEFELELVLVLELVFVFVFVLELVLEIVMETELELVFARVCALANVNNTARTKMTRKRIFLF